jgi:hypothetical protein
MSPGAVEVASLLRERAAFRNKIVRGQDNNTPEID